MSTLSTISTGGLAAHCQLDSPDGYFQLLSDACHDLDAEAGHLLHAQLVLLLMNHIGDETVVREAIVIARQGLRQHDVTGRHPHPDHTGGART